MIEESALVTVGIPFQKEPPAVFAKAIASVILQSLTAWRLVLVGDAPGSEQINVARAAAAQDARISVIVHDECRGLAYRLNELTSVSGTPLVARMDADDIMRRTRLERQVEAFDADSKLDVCGSRAIVIDEDDVVEGLLREQPDIPTDPTGRVQSNLLTHPTVMARLSWMERYPYSSQYARAEDKELWLRTIDTSLFGKLPDPLLFYRVPRELGRRKSIRTVLDGLDAGGEYSRRHLARSQRLAECVKAGVKVAGYGLATERMLRSIRGLRVEAADNLAAESSAELTEIRMRAEHLTGGEG